MNSKYYTTMKVTAQARQLLSKTSEDMEFDGREEVYEGKRDVLCVEFRFIFLIKTLKILIHIYVIKGTRQGRKRLVRLCVGSG